MLRRRNILIVVVLALAALVVAALLLFWRGQAPEAVRLLPVADGYVYVDLTPLRTAGLFKEPAANLDPDYAQFVRDTGFQFERDLDEAAFAIHLPSAAAGTGTTPAETRYSEVLVGRFDGSKVADYLRKTAASSQPYRKAIIYSIPLPGRTLRVAVLSKDMVAASNADNPLFIQEMIDHYGEPLRSGPELIRRYYRNVPLASVAWAVVRTAPAAQAGNARYELPGGFDLFFPPETVMVAAVRYLGSVQFRASIFARNKEDAQRVADQLNAFLALARTLEVRAQDSADPDIKAFFDSISVSQLPDRAELNATIPAGFVKKILSEPPAEAIGAAPAPPEVKKPQTGKRRSSKK